MPEFDSEQSSVDRDRWDARYRAGEHATAIPSSTFTALKSHLPAPGRGLDVAGGAGRHAIWLAQQGWNMTVADISTVALELARARATAAGIELTTQVCDVERSGIPLGPWDLIVCFHFLWRPLLQRICQELTPGGRLIVVQPTRRNLERHARPSAQYLVDEGELPQLVPQMNIVHCQELWTAEGRHEAILVAELVEASL